MANPQIENGHIDIANEIAEQLARIQLSGYESRILWVLWRKTYGWHKKSDHISTTQFVKATNIARRHVHATLKKLVRRNLITENSNDFITKWSFQKNYNKWQLVTEISNKINSLPISAPLVTENGNKLVTEIGAYKRKKESNTKERPHRLIKKVKYKDKHLALAKLLEKLIKENKPDYIFAGGHLDKWADEIRLMEEKDKRDLNKVSVIIGWALNHSFWKTNILSGSKLRKQFDKLEIQRKEELGGSKQNRQHYKTDGSRKKDKYEDLYET